jgi:HK97 gp10 family phage protein
VLKANVIGLDSYLKRLQTAKKTVQAEVSGEIGDAAMKFRDDAARTAVANGGDRGTLAKSISAQQNNLFNWTVAVGATYGAFVEFGTKGKARVPAGFEDVAARFKGFKGNGGKLYDAIYQWVKRKGLTATYSVKTQRRSKFTKSEEKRTQEVAFLIARSIYRYGITPKPFFYMQVTPVRNQLFERIKVIMNGI